MFHMDRIRNYILISLVCAVAVSYSSGCAKPTPVETVQTYLQMLSGEREVTDSAIKSITTECYRTAEEKDLVNLTSAHREWFLDKSSELRKSPAIKEFLERVKWETVYDVTQPDDASARVVARVILAEQNPGDREKALAIKDLPQPLVDIIRRGLELPFQFDLKKVDGKWLIDGCTCPEALITLFESVGIEATDSRQ
jgi:hypothetical protein